MKTSALVPRFRLALDTLTRRGRAALLLRNRAARPSIHEQEPITLESDDAQATPSLAPVLFLHGLNMPALVMSPLAWMLRRHTKRPTHNLRFRWMHDDLPATARHVAAQVKALGVTEYDVVTHSMGGIVLRWMVNHCGVPAPRRVVMIAAPNGGSWLASHLHKRLGIFYPLIFGRPGMQLRAGTSGIVDRAGLLDGSEVGIIAGGCGSPAGKRNWFSIPGDCDGTVAVQETILPGMKDFVLVNADHSRILYRRDVLKLVETFLTHGVFRPGAKVGHHHG